MTWEIRQGDALERLREMPSGSVQCCITSPPYFGLRDYGEGEWEGGDPECDHALPGSHQAQGATSIRAGRANVEAQRNETFRTRVVGNAPSLKSTLTTNNGAGPRPGDKYHADERRVIVIECACGARRVDRQIGLEPTPEEYVERLVEVFREVRRVLHNDGVLWLNLGDSYASSGGQRRGVGETSGLHGAATSEHYRQTLVDRDPTTRDTSRYAGVKDKDLLGIPWMVAFALRQDGWWLRSDIIWHKPNPMPESVTDRPTQAHEHVFLLTKAQRYFYDAEAIREDALWPGGPNGQVLSPFGQGFTRTGTGGDSPDGKRNRRNVWEISTQPYAEAHFATFPIKLVEPCVKAGSARGDTVMDPFAGSGTVGVVCEWYGRDFLGIDLNPDYCRMARRRILRRDRTSQMVEVHPDQMEFELETG